MDSPHWEQGEAEFVPPLFLYWVKNKRRDPDVLPMPVGSVGSWEKLFRNVSVGLFRLPQGCGQDWEEKKIHQFKKHLFTSGSNKDKEE